MKINLNVKELIIIIKCICFQLVKNPTNEKWYKDIEKVYKKLKRVLLSNHNINFEIKVLDGEKIENDK